MREYVLHGWDEIKCAKHRRNALEGGFKTQCDRDGTCAFTGVERIKLTYEEHMLLQEVLDFTNTREMLSKNIEHRQRIIFLSNRLHEMQSQKEKLERGGKRRTAD